MSVVLDIVAPVFALIALGFAAGRWKLLDPVAGRGLTEFAFRLGIPALLCRTIATAKLDTLSVTELWASFYVAAIATWALATVATRLLLKRPSADGAAIAMVATFGNTAMLGLPLVLATYGQEALAPVAVILAIHAPVLWLMGLAHSAIVGDHGGASPMRILASVARELAQNAIIIGIVLGASWRLTGLELPVAVDKTLALVAQAGVPASLVALGLSLLSFEIKGQSATLIVVLLLKLAVMPLAAWTAATAFGLTGAALGAVVILAAMPTGANAFLFATREGRAVNSASGAVALGSGLAALTSAATIALLAHPG